MSAIVEVYRAQWRKACHVMEWVCEYCGAEGESSEPVDEIQCPTCGEPVTPKG
jgi:DNA-directed RNA polymerase subunit RPC12/RpoP